MKGATVAIDTLPDGAAGAARLVDGSLEDILVDPAPNDAAPRPGAIYRAVPGRPMKGLGGAMVELGGGATGFLRETRGLVPGRPLLVQVSGWAEPGKAPPVSGRLLLKRRLAILTPGAPGLNLARSAPAEARPRLEALAAEAMAGADAALGLILRSAAPEAGDGEILAEIAALRGDWERIAAAGASGAPGLVEAAASAAEEARRDWPEPGPGGLDDRPGAFARHGIWEAIDALVAPQVALPGGARLYVEPTRACVTVDVNTGSDLSPAAALKANLAAARALPRQLRLRGLGGTVLVDFAPLPRKDRPRVADALKATLARDGIETTLAGWTPLGNLELLRKRARRPLAELVAGRLP